MASRRYCSLTVYLAPTKDDQRVRLTDYPTPEHFQNAFKSERNRPPKWELSWATDWTPRASTKVRQQSQGISLPFDIQLANTFPHAHLAQYAAGKESQEPPSTSAWNPMTMDFSFMRRGSVNLYYLGEDKEESSAGPADEGRDDPIPSIERD